MPHHSGFSLRVFAVMALSIAAALIAIVATFDHASRSAMTAAAERDLQQLIDVQREQIEALINARVEETRLLATLPGVREDLLQSHAATDRGALTSRLQRFIDRGNGLRLLAVVHPDSGRVLSASDARLLDVSLASDPLLDASRNDAAVHGPDLSPLLQLHGLTVATPMRDSDGQLRAILFAAFDTSSLERMFADQAAWRPDTRLQLSASSQSECLAEPDASADAGAVIALRQWLPRHRLCLTAETDSDHLLASADAARREALAVAIPLMLLVLVAAGWLQRDQRKQLAAARRTAEPVAARVEELERFADLAQELFATLSSDGRFLRINGVWPSELEYSLAQLDGQAFIDLVHPDDRDASAEALASLGHDARPVELENRFIDSSGDYRRIRWRITGGSSGTLCLGGMLVAMPATPDIEELAAPEQVRQIRTALNGLFGALALLRKTSLDPQQQLMLELAHSGGDSLLSALPEAARSSGESGGNDTRLQSTPDFTDTRVLVVEDDATSRQVTALVLSGLGCEVDTAENGAVALERIEAKDYHLVLMDCEMPVMDGFAATAAIREHEGERHLPVIAVTALSGREERQRCFAAGMDDYLGKPVSERALTAALLRWRLRPVSALDAPETLDRSTLERLHATAQATSPAMLEQILAAFVDDSQQRIEAMRTSIKRRDFDVLRRAAHELKGASGVVGAQQMMRCCGKLQELAEQRSVDGAESLLDRLEANFMEVREALTAWTS